MSRRNDDFEMTPFSRLIRRRACNNNENRRKEGMKKRHVDRAISIFDLADCEDLRLPQRMSGRVMFVYDEKEKLKGFTLLNTTIPKEMQRTIKSWLEKNIEVCDSLCGFGV
jgi:hypothetical protein